MWSSGIGVKVAGTEKKEEEFLDGYLDGKCQLYESHGFPSGLTLVSIFRIGWQKKKVRSWILQELHSKFREAKMRTAETHKAKWISNAVAPGGDTDRKEEGHIARNNQLFVWKVTYSGHWIFQEKCPFNDVVCQKKSKENLNNKGGKCCKVLLALYSGRPGPSTCPGWAGSLRNWCFLLWPPHHFQRWFTESCGMRPQIKGTTPFSYHVYCLSSAPPSWALFLFFLHLMENVFFQKLISERSD